MKYILFTSETFTGEIEYVFDRNECLSSLEIRASLDDKQRLWITRNVPLNIQELYALRSQSKTITLTEIKIEITFEMFWNRYNHKEVSSKKKSEAIWNRMSQADRIAAYNYVPRYFNSIPAGISKKYAETYLNSKLWKN